MATLLQITRECNYTTNNENLEFFLSFLTLNDLWSKKDSTILADILDLKIEAAELRFLRPMAGYTLLDKERSSNIREQLGMFNITDKLTHYKINWREHI